MLRSLPVALFLAAFILGLLPASPVHACTQPPDGHIESSTTERTLSAEVVLLGEITAVRNAASGAPGEVADVLVEQYLKGAGGPAILVIRGFGSTALCRSPVRVGQHWIIYADGAPESGELRVNYLEAFSGVSQPNPAVITEVLAVAEREPVVPESVPAIATPDLTATHTQRAIQAATPVVVAASTAFDTPQIFAEQQFRAALPYLGVVCACLVLLIACIAGGVFLVLNRRKQ